MCCGRRSRCWVSSDSRGRPRFRPEDSRKASASSLTLRSLMHRGPAHVLRGGSINVDPDEVVALVGRNGAGRTTIIESIIGLLPVRSGRIRFREEEITSLPPHRRAKRGIGYAPENSGIFPELTVAENLMISRWLSAKTGRRP